MAPSASRHLLLNKITAPHLLAVWCVRNVHFHLTHTHTHTSAAGWSPPPPHSPLAVAACRASWHLPAASAGRALLYFSAEWGCSSRWSPVGSLGEEGGGGTYSSPWNSGPVEMGDGREMRQEVCWRWSHTERQIEGGELEQSFPELCPNTEK